MLASLSLLLGGRAVSTPFPRFAAAGEGATDDVVLVVTHIVIDAGQRAEFDRQTRRVIDGMSSQPGLSGFSARREIFGYEGWTIGVWTDDEARACFARSPVHLEAIAKSAPAIVRVEVKRLTMARSELPTSWARALEILVQPGGRRVD